MPFIYLIFIIVIAYFLIETAVTRGINNSNIAKLLEEKFNENSDLPLEYEKRFLDNDLDD